MADRSELRWRVVQHYLADSIADYAADKNRIKKATRSAEADLKVLHDKKGEYGAFCFSRNNLCFLRICFLIFSVAYHFLP